MSSHRRDLLLEIGTEELPPKSLAALGAELARSFDAGCTGAGLTRAGELKYFTGPRRLAVFAGGLDTTAPSMRERRLGPAVAAAYDHSGKPTAAAAGFARSCGVSVEQLQTVETDKGSRLVFEAEKPGASAKELLPGIFQRALEELPVARRMRWGTGTAEFVRPVHWVVALLGEEVIECELLGVRSGNTSRGHRYHHPGPVAVTPARYAPALREAMVWVDDETGDLRQEISRQASALAEELDGIALDSESSSTLVQEVAALLEWPVALRGEFDHRFLELPEEVLIAVLKGQQRYFPVRDRKSGRLLPGFVALANIESRRPEEIRRGNERVIAPRLSDAQFFWETDRAISLESRAPLLEEVIFQDRLGSVADKMRRVAKLAKSLAGEMGGDETAALRAAQLAKCDLVSSLVGEFPELQGTVGRHLAKHEGESAEVAAAIEEHYQPRFADDRLPRTNTGRALAMADKLDTIAAIFTLGQLPTGQKDPFGLRRAALGALRIIIECETDVDLERLIGSALRLCRKDLKPHAVSRRKKNTKRGRIPSDAELETAIFEFMMERLRAYYADAGIRPEIFEAVRARSPARPLDFHHRVQAVMDFYTLPQARSLAAANKRIRNILRQAGGDPGSRVNRKLLSEPAESGLAEAVEDAARAIAPLVKQRDYKRALSRLAELRDQVDLFFDQVLVMCEEKALRHNRLALLKRLHELFLSIADVSMLPAEGT